MSNRRRDPENPLTPGEGRPVAEGGPRADLGEYTDAFRQGRNLALEQLGGILQEIDRAAGLVGELLQESAPGRRHLIENQPRFHALKLSELLLGRSREAWFTDPSTAIELAELAVVVSDRLDLKHYGRSLVEDARARAWAYLGNAWRIASDLRRAEKAFRTAEEHHRQAGEDAYTWAEIQSFKASLRNAQGRFEEASALLDSVVQVYREARDRHREGRALIQKATALSYAGRQAQAIRSVRRGLTKIDIYEEPRLLVSGRHNLIGYLNETGQHEEALQVLQETRSLYLEIGERSHLVRLRWLEGKIHRDLGHLNEAETALREVRDALVERALGLDAALASLDLAMIYLERGETGELKRLAAEMIPVFESRDDHQKALAAFLLFRQAADAEQVTLGLLQEMASSLEQVRRSGERG